MLLGLGCKCRAVSGALLRLVQILLLVLLVRYKFVWGMFLPLQCAIGMTRILVGRTPFFMEFLISHLFHWHMSKHKTTSRNWWRSGEDTEALPLAFTWVSFTGSPLLKNGLVWHLLCLNAVQFLLPKTASFTVPQVRFPKVPPSTLPVLQSVSGGWDL